MKDFKTSQERTDWIIANAEHFTVVRFLGRGKYEKHQYPTQAEAESAAKAMANAANANYMVYAVYGTHDTLVKGVKPEGIHAARARPT